MTSASRAGAPGAAASSARSVRPANRRTRGVRRPAACVTISGSTPMTVAICSGVTWPGRSRRGGSGLGGCQIENRRLDADRAAAAVEDQGHGIAEFVAHMRGFGRADAAEAVGRWGGDAAHAGQPAAGPRIGAQQASASGCAGTRRPTLSWPPVTAVGTAAARLRIRVSGPGQKAFGQFPGHARECRAPSGRDSRRPADGRSAGDRPVAPWRRRSGDGGGIGGVGTEAIDRLGRKGDQFAGLQQRDGAIDVAGSGGIDDSDRGARAIATAGHVPGRHRAP
jgi:hypothetical protein